MSKSNIIIGSDLSTESNLAIKVGIEWSDQLSMGCSVAHIFPQEKKIDNVDLYDPQIVEHFERMTQILEDDLKEKLAEQINEVNAQKENILQYIGFGDRAKKLIQLAQKRNGKMITLGWSKKFNEDSLWLASTIDRVIRGSHIPVLIVKNDKCFSPKNILVPFDLDRAIIDSLEWIKFIGESFNSKLTFFHAHKSDLHESNKTYELDYLHEISSEVEKVEEIERFIRLYNLSGLQAQSKVVTCKQKVKAVLENELTQNQYDLIVMPSHGLSGLEKLYMGSIAEWVTKLSSCSVLITKSRQKA